MALYKRQMEEASGPEEKDTYDILGSVLSVGGAIAGGAIAAGATGGMSLAAMPAILAGSKIGQGVGTLASGFITPYKASGQKQIAQGINDITTGAVGYAAAEPKVMGSLFNKAITDAKQYASQQVSHADKVAKFAQLTQEKPFTGLQNAKIAGELGLTSTGALGLTGAQNLPQVPSTAPSSQSAALARQAMARYGHGQGDNVFHQQLTGSGNLQRPPAGGMGDWRQMWQKNYPGQQMPEWMSQPFQQRLTTPRNFGLNPIQ